jgi:predicted Zn-dependent peptidase
MSFTNTTLKSPSLNPFKALGGEIEYTIHDLTHRVKSLGRSALEKLRSLKPVSREFTQKLASPDGIAQEYIYTNGLRVFNVHDKKIKRTSVQLTIQLPQTHEKIAGTNHFLEHMLVTNPLNSLKKDIMTWASENGVACDAGTSNEKMFFSFSLAPDKLKMVLKFLANLYQEKPLEYDPKILEGERDVIQKERQGYENNPAWALGFKLAEFFKGKGHYSSKNILGTKKDISEISQKHLEEARKRFNIAESTLVINSPSSYLADASIHECFKDIKPKELKNERTPVAYSELSKEAKQVFKHHDLPDSLIQVFYPNPEKLLKSKLSTLDKQRLTGTLLLTMFAGDDSRLRQEFNKQKINVGSVGINFDNEDRGALNLSINRTDKKYFSKVLPIIHQQLKKIAAEGLNLEELNLVKRMVVNGKEVTEEDPASQYQAAIETAISQEHEHWLDFTPDQEMKDFWNKITKDQESLNAFNDELKEFLDIYFLSAKSKTLETHCDNHSNVGNFSSENMQVGVKTQSHYARPVVEPSQKPDFIRLPAGLASMKKLDERSYLVKDKEANLVRVYVLNKNGMGRLSDTILNSSNPNLISEETYKQELLSSFAESLFTETLGAEASLSPENIDKVTKNLGVSFDFEAEAKILSFSMSGVKKGAVEMLGLLKQIFATPALLSDKPEVKSRVREKFDHAIEEYTKNLLETKQDRDSLLDREFYNAIFASDPERQSLDIDSQIKILKSINLDDVRKFFKENYIFDENLKILLNDVAVGSGLNPDAVADTLMQLNPGKVKAKEPYEYKVLEVPSSKKIVTFSDLEKSSASIMIGNLTEDLSGLSKEDRILLTLSLNALRGGMTSGLGARLREKGIYHWNLNFVLPSENLGKVTFPQKPFSINCHCNPSQVDEIRQVISTTLKEYLADGPTPEALDQEQHALTEAVAGKLKNTQERYNFFTEAFKTNKAPSAQIKAFNRSYRDMQPRAKELLKMVIKPDNFIEVVDIPKSASQAPEWNQNYSGRFKNT